MPTRCRCPHGEEFEVGVHCTAKDLNKPLFHISTTPLQPGHVMDAGSRANTPHAAFFLLPPPPEVANDQKFLRYSLLERIFEAVRVRVTPDHPSRRESAFAFACRGCAVDFAALTRPGATIYEVECDSQATVFVGDLKLRDTAVNVANLTSDERNSRNLPADMPSAIAQVAYWYWNGDTAEPPQTGHATPEVLILADLRVVRTI